MTILSTRLAAARITRELAGTSTPSTLPNLVLPSGTWTQHTRVVTERDLAAFKVACRRAGARIVGSAPHPAGYRVTFARPAVATDVPEAADLPAYPTFGA